MADVLRFQRRHERLRAELTFRNAIAGEAKITEIARFATPAEVWDWMRGRWDSMVRLEVRPLHGQAIEDAHRVAAEREAELLDGDGGAA